MDLCAASYETEMLGRRKHVPVVGPDLSFPGFQCADKLDGITRAQKNLGGECDYERIHSPDQPGSHGHERPQLAIDMSKKFARERLKLLAAEIALRRYR